MKAAQLVARVREPSTWAGFAALAMLFGQAEAAAALHVLGASVPDVFAAGAALLSVVLKEAGK